MTIGDLLPLTVLLLHNVKDDGIHSRWSYMKLVLIIGLLNFGLAAISFTSISSFHFPGVKPQIVKTLITQPFFKLQTLNFHKKSG